MAVISKGSRMMDNRLIVRVVLVTLFLLQCFCDCTKPAQADLEVGFYDNSGTCIGAEGIVSGVVAAAFVADNTITASLIRLQFHDCFVQGCDASIMLNGTFTERTSLPNLSVRGYGVVDDAKAILEEICPGVVSCADIITLAARDSIAILGGPSFDVLTGRLDGLARGPDSPNPLFFLPGPNFTIPQATAAFQVKGLSQTDMVNLLGAHTVGVSQCRFFIDRLYNFLGTGRPDPDMDPAYVNILRKICPNVTDPSDPSLNTNAALDFGSEFAWDLSYFRNVKRNRGLLRIDDELGTDPATKGHFIQIGSSNLLFNQAFIHSFTKLSQVGVILDPERGNIRTVCEIPIDPEIVPEIVHTALLEEEAALSAI